LREYAKLHGQNAVIQVAQSIETADTAAVPEEHKQLVRRQYAEYLECDAAKLRTTNVKELVDVLEPDSLLERFAAKRKAGVAATRDFVAIKGKEKVVAKGQVEHATGPIDG